MDYAKAVRVAEAVLHRTGLYDQGWRMRETRANSIMGACYYHDKTIRLSRPNIEINSAEEAWDTILHEVAHALAGHSAGHGPAWKRQVKALGGNPVRTAVNAVRAPQRYRGTCGKCGHVSERSRRTPTMTQVSCGKCSRTFNPALMLLWVDTKTGERIR